MESKRFTEGIAFDGAAILDNGQPITITEILNNLNRLDELEQLALFSVSVTERKSCHVCGTTEYYITDDGHKACKKHRCYLTSGKN